MYKRNLLSRLCFLLIITSISTVNANEVKKSPKPSEHAPIGIMRDHVHNKGEWMLSYRLSYMHMEGNLDGTSSVKTEEILKDYMVAPTKMQMTMHMFGVMYGVSDKLTMAVMGGFTDKETDNINDNNISFTMDNNGITDTKVNALYQLYNNKKHRFQFNMGISLPTGSFNEKKIGGELFPYPMQIGSGTYDLLPGISYSGAYNDWSWGGQLNTTLRLGENNQGYTLGNRYQLTGWGALELSNMFSLSLRIDGKLWENIDDKGINLNNTMFMSPAMDPKLQAGESIELLGGINFIVPSGKLKGNRLALEFGMPVYERLDGPRLEKDYHFTVGWQLAF